jgi:hypothetical protein
MAIVIYSMLKDGFTNDISSEDECNLHPQNQVSFIKNCLFCFGFHVEIRCYINLIVELSGTAGGVPTFLSPRYDNDRCKRLSKLRE